MAIGTGTALLISGLLSAAGSGYNAYSQSQGARRANRRQDSLLGEAAGMRTSGPSDAEQLIMQLLGGGNDAGSSFNVGQDALMQMLRAPGGAAEKSLNSMVGTGNPFDTSGLFESLGVVDQRMIDSNADALRAGASGLGQRFGTAATRAEGSMRREALQDIGARNAQVAMGSHESAQDRILQSAAQLLGIDQMRGGWASTLGQMGMQEQGMETNLLSMLLGAENSRRGFNLQTLGLGAGMQPMMPGYTYGNALGDVGQLIMMMQLLGGSGTRTAGGRNG